VSEALTIAAFALLLTSFLSPGFASWLAGRLRAAAVGLESHAAGMAAAYAAYRAVQRSTHTENL
jgi:hypothetical protein